MKKSYIICKRSIPVRTSWTVKKWGIVNPQLGIHQVLKNPRINLLRNYHHSMIQLETGALKKRKYTCIPHIK